MSASLAGLLVIGVADPALAAPTPSPSPSGGSSTATPSPQPPDTKVAEAAAAKARAAADLAGEKLGLARQAAAAAERAADAARADAAQARAVADASLAALEEMARRDYMNGQVTPGLGWLLLAGSADDPLSALRAVGQLDLATQDQAGIVARATRDARAALKAQRESAAASVRAGDAAAKAEQAKAQLDEAAARASDVLAAARERDRRVAAEQAREAAAAAAAGATGHDRSTWLGQAAQDLRARALAAGAATARQLDAADGDAALLAAAANALLEQAAGHGSPPPAGLSPAAPGLAFHPDGYPHSPAAAAHEPQALTPAIDPLPGLESGGVGLDGTSPWGHVAAPLLAANGVTVAPAIPAPSGRPDGAPLAASVAVTSALRQLGTPYVWAASGPTTFDCSGLMLWAWGQAGVRLDHFSGAQWDEGRPVPSPDDLLPGDLLLFATPDSGIHHVAMYLGAGWMVHAPRSGTYVTVAPVATMGDQLIGAVRP